MSELEHTRPFEASARPDTVVDKLAREAELLSTAASSFADRAKSQFEHNRLTVTGEFAISFAVAAAMTYASKGEGIAELGAGLSSGSKTAAGLLGAVGLSTAALHLKPSIEAFVDAAHADCNFAADQRVMKENLAPFLFDASVTTGGLLAGGLAGANLSKSRLYESNLPNFTDQGDLPPGIHRSTWREFEERYGYNSTRKDQLFGMETLLQEMRKQGVSDTAYVGGSFVTRKNIPGDFDMTWRVSGETIGELQEKAPLLVDRSLQKQQLGGELMATYPDSPGDGVLGFLQSNRRRPVGVVELSTKTLPSRPSFVFRKTVGKATDSVNQLIENLGHLSSR